MAVEVKDPTMQSALEMCNLSWTPPSSLEKDVQLSKPLLGKPKDGLFGVYKTKKELRHETHASLF